MLPQADFTFYSAIPPAIATVMCSIGDVDFVVLVVEFFAYNRVEAEAYDSVCLCLAGDSELLCHRRINQTVCPAVALRRHSLSPWHPYHALRQYVQSLAVRTGRTVIHGRLDGNAFDICGRHWFCS